MSLAEDCPIFVLEFDMSLLKPKKHKQTRARNDEGTMRNRNIPHLFLPFQNNYTRSSSFLCIRLVHFIFSGSSELNYYLIYN